MRSVASLRARLRRAERLLRKLRANWTGSYDRGKYVEKLGIKASTPCLVIVDPKGYRAALKLTVPLALGRRPRGAYVCHRCDVYGCVKADHLFWGTSSDNARDCVLKGRHVSGAQLSVEELNLRFWIRVANVEARVKRLRDRLTRVDPKGPG